MGNQIAPEPLQRRAKDFIRAEVAATAIRLFLDEGFDAVTVDEITAAAGLSRRSFFRYFRSKEDVVVSVFTELAEQGGRTFVERLSSDGVWGALRRSMDPVVEWAEQDHRRALALMRLVFESDSLRAGYLDRVDRWSASLASVMRGQLGLDRDASLYATVVATAGMGAYVAGARAWVNREGAVSLSLLFDQAFAAVEAGPIPLRSP
jgi:AcrR family transcriptional regulator